MRQSLSYTMLAWWLLNTFDEDVAKHAENSEEKVFRRSLDVLITEWLKNNLTNIYLVNVKMLHRLRL